MVPFRVFDRKNKQMWQVISHNQGSDGGMYLAAREDDSEHDGDMSFISGRDIVGYKFVEFIEESDSMG